MQEPVWPTHAQRVRLCLVCCMGAACLPTVVVVAVVVSLINGNKRMLERIALAAAQTTVFDWPNKQNGIRLDLYSKKITISSHTSVRRVGV